MSDLFGNEIIRTLGLYQPFAALMLHGKIETRFVRNKLKKAPFPLGKYLIYSCKNGYDISEGDLDSICSWDQVDKIIELSNQDFAFTKYGMALCIGDLVRIIDPLTEDVDDTFVAYIAPDSCYRRVGMVFENIKRITPFYIKGKQGIGFLSNEDKTKIQESSKELKLLKR